MWKLFITKFMKSELWVALGSIVVALVAPKLGIPEEHLMSLWATLGAIVVGYAGARSHEKSNVAKSKATAIKAAVENKATDPKP